MNSYIIYVSITYENQFSRINPDLIKEIRAKLDETAGCFGGQRNENDCYHFPSTLADTIHKVAKTASALQKASQPYRKEVYDITLILTLGESTYKNRIEMLKLHIVEENQLWLDPQILNDFKPYFTLKKEDELFRIISTKKDLVLSKEKLSQFLIRHDLINTLKNSLKALEKNKDFLLLQGMACSGKRATLKEALHQLNPDNMPSTLTINFSRHKEHPLEPFVRVIRDAESSLTEYLNEEEKTWLDANAKTLMKSILDGRIGDNGADQQELDILQIFIFSIKAHIREQQQSGRPAYLLIDGCMPDFAMVPKCFEIINELRASENFHLILIEDSEDFDKGFSVSGNGLRVSFKPTNPKQLVKTVNMIFSDANLNERQITQLSKNCNSNLYKMYHSILTYKKQKQPGTSHSDSLLESLNSSTKCGLFLAHAAVGLANRSMLSNWHSLQNNAKKKSMHYDNLLSYGLIRETPDGRIRDIPFPLSQVFLKNTEYRKQAEKFGEYLYQKYAAGASIDIVRFFHYLEHWGPLKRGIIILNQLFEHLLNCRYLRTAEHYLKDSLFSNFKLNRSDRDALSDIIEVARLRYLMLNTVKKDKNNFFRRVNSYNHESRAYSTQLCLQDAIYCHSMGNWEDSLVLSKDALFMNMKSANHTGQIYSHLQMARSLLALGKIRDAMEHCSIARRISTQVRDVPGGLAAAALYTVSQYLYGNLIHALQISQEYRSIASFEGYRELWLIFTLSSLRICFDLGRYAETVRLAEEAHQLCEFYNLADQNRVMTVWKGRGLAAQHKTEGLSLLESCAESDNGREALAFLSEKAWFEGRDKEALLLIQKAIKYSHHNVNLQGLTENWSDGFFPLEGHLTDADKPLDALGEWISGFDAFLASLAGDAKAYSRLTALLEEEEGRKRPRPFSHQYALWAFISSENKKQRSHWMHHAVSEIQSLAGRFENNQIRNEWLTANPWNKQLMDEAERYKKG